MWIFLIFLLHCVFPTLGGFAADLETQAGILAEGILVVLFYGVWSHRQPRRARAASSLLLY